MGDVKRLVRENEDMRLAQLRDFDQEGWRAGGGGGAHQAQVSELTERLAYVEEERGCLLKQKEMVVAELEECLRERSEADERCAAISADLKELAYTRAFLDQTVREKEQAEETVVAQARQLSEEQARGRAQAEATRLLRDEVNELSGRCERAEDERKRGAAEAEAAGEALHSKVQVFAARIRDLQARLADRTAEWERSVAAERETARSLEQTSRDNAGMMALMGNMERQLADFAEREGRTEAAAAECRAAAEQALLERDAAVSSESYLRAELARLREVRVDEYSERVAQHEQAMREARDEDRREVAAKESQIKRLTEANETLRATAERSRRERDSFEVRLSQLAATLDNERRLVGERCRGLEQRVVNAEALAALRQAELEGARSSGRSEVAKLERLMREAERLRTEEEERRASAETVAAAAEERLEEALSGRDRDRDDKAALLSERDATARSLKRLEGAERDAAAAAAATEELRHACATAEMRLADATALAQGHRESAAREQEWAKVKPGRNTRAVPLYFMFCVALTPPQKKNAPPPVHRLTAPSRRVCCSRSSNGSGTARRAPKLARRASVSSAPNWTLRLLK